MMTIERIGFFSRRKKVECIIFSLWRQFRRGPLKLFLLFKVDHLFKMSQTRKSAKRNSLHYLSSDILPQKCQKIFLFSSREKPRMCNLKNFQKCDQRNDRRSKKHCFQMKHSALYIHAYFINFDRKLTNCKSVVGNS
jgi:hypothetical protein